MAALLTSELTSRSDWCVALTAQEAEHPKVLKDVVQLTRAVTTGEETYLVSMCEVFDTSYFTVLPLFVYIHATTHVCNELRSKALQQKEST